MTTHLTVQLTAPEQMTAWCPDYINNLVYGPSGTGKTIYASTWPKPILYLDTDKGMLSIATFVQDLSSIFHVEITDKSLDTHINYPIGWASIKQILNQIIDTGKYFTLTPATIVLDSLTTASRYAMTYAQFQNKRINQRPVIQDWGDQMSELLEVINLGIATRANFVCVAHEQYQKDELSGRIWCLPLTTGKLAGQVSLYFDETYHAKTGMAGTQTTFQLETKASGLVTAKSRLNLPSTINADYAEIEKVLATLRARKGGVEKSQPVSVQVPSPILPQAQTTSWVTKS